MIDPNELLPSAFRNTNVLPVAAVVAAVAPLTAVPLPLMNPVKFVAVLVVMLVAPDGPAGPLSESDNDVPFTTASLYSELAI